MKIIETSNIWACASMDALAPITAEGVAILYDDNTVDYEWDGEQTERRATERATEDERRAFARRRGYIFEGDTVEVVKGRKLPIGAVKTVASGYRYYVDGTYGHRYTDYLVFTDGTKTAVGNIRAVGVDRLSGYEGINRFAERMPYLLEGGRVSK